MFARKKKPPIVNEYQGMKMFMVENDTDLSNLENNVANFLESVLGLRIDGTFPHLSSKQVAYVVYYFDGTELYKDEGPLSEASDVIAASIRKFLREVEGDNTMTSTFVSPYGLVTLVGIKMEDNGEHRNVMPIAGHC